MGKGRELFFRVNSSTRFLDGGEWGRRRSRERQSISRAQGIYGKRSAKASMQKTLPQFAVVLAVPAPAFKAVVAVATAAARQASTP